jgi:hypothetical protein
MKQINVRVEDKVGQAFYQFCERQRITPYELLSSIVGFYGRAEIITQGRDKKTLTDEEALIEVGRVVADMQKFAQANGEFLEGVAALLKPYGVELANLWPTWKEAEGATQP